MLAVPLKLAAGVKVTTPPATVQVPWALVKVVWIPGVVGSRSTVLLSIVPSRSVSLVVTFTVTGVSSLVEATSLLATGASFTGTTLTVMVAAFEVAPLLSLTV